LVRRRLTGSLRRDGAVSVDGMTESDAKTELMIYLQRGRETLLWKLDGLSEYDARRPMTATATNLLGVVKHVASVEADYLGRCFGRPFAVPLPWLDDDAEANADMWAPPEESRPGIVALYRQVWAHSDETVKALTLDAFGEVPWWPAERRNPTLHRVLTHLIAETHRHAGHMDILRELIDESAGLLPDVSNMPEQDRQGWLAYRERVEAAAKQAAQLPSPHQP
jgi:uncharacterized damage-inducible protein DinB